MRNSTFFSALTLCCMASGLVWAQEVAPDVKYRRSSLSMVLVEADEFPNKAAVMTSWGNYPFPDKYNKHEVGLKSMALADVQLSLEEQKQAGFTQDTLSRTKNATKVALAEAAVKSGTNKSKTITYLDEDKSTMVVSTVDEEKVFKAKVDKIIKKDKLANQLIASWFGLRPDAGFAMNLVQQRGFYNASELEASIAKGQSKGLAALGDAGETLIKNTFVTFTQLEFVENEVIARAVRDAAKVALTLSGKSELVVQLGMKAADIVYEKTKEGYLLKSKTLLYRLRWDNEISNTFYTKYWNDPQAFMNADEFELEFVGEQTNSSLVTFKLTGEKRTQEQIIDLALVRNVDNAFAKLQKEHDVFKPIVPVLSVEPITAQIGMKEGLSGNEKFEVLELVQNPETGMTEYKTVGKVSVDSKGVWDNRYNAGQDAEDKPSNVELKATIFKGGGKNIQPGMLLKQVK